jgi:hypothetical protein
MLAAVVTVITEHVDDGDAHLPWASQDPRVVPGFPDGSFAGEDSIETTGHPRGYAPHAVGKTLFRVGLAEKMDVVRLDTIVCEAKTGQTSDTADGTDHGREGPRLKENGEPVAAA